MSDTIPPLYSSSPPPLTKSNFVDDGDSEEDEDEDDDEDGYGKFEEFSAVYDHTCEEILNSSHKSIQPLQSKSSLNTSGVILGKETLDFSKSLSSTTGFNSSSLPLSSDILHSKTSDETINPKILENNSINLEDQFSESAIKFPPPDNILSSNQDKLAVHNLVVEPSSDFANFSSGDAVGSIGNAIENSLKGISIVKKSEETTSIDRCDLNFISNVDVGGNSAAHEPVPEKVESFGDFFSSQLRPTVSENCSNVPLSVIDGTVNDDDFDFNEFQSCSEPFSTTGGTIENGFSAKAPLFDDNAFAFSENFVSGKSDSLSCEAFNFSSLPAQTEIVNKRINGSVEVSFANDFSSLNEKSSDFERSQASYIDSISESCNTPTNASPVHENSSDLFVNGFGEFQNTVLANSDNVTAFESNNSFSYSSLNSVALESNQITEDIIKAKKLTEIPDLNTAPPRIVSSENTDSSNLFGPDEDGFGDFECAVLPDVVEPQVPSLQPESAQSSDNEFLDFESADSLKSKQLGNEDSEKFDQSQLNAVEGVFESDFASTISKSATAMSDASDFQSTNLVVKNSASDNNAASLESEACSEENFGDFKASFSDAPALTESGSPSNIPESTADDEFDDFSDFNAYEQDTNSKVDSIDLSSQQESPFWVTLFACEEGVREIDVVSISDLVVASRIWTKLREMDSSPKFSLEWSKSAAYNKLLSTLNIDVRNMFGLYWKSNVPRFAANLGCAPLEPSKAAKDSNSSLNPVSDFQSEPSVSNHPDFVPAAHFDWISSGLVNPLDCSYSTLLDINLLDSFVSSESAKKRGNPVKEAPKPSARDEAIDTEVREFLQSLPDLSFMLVSNIQFPMNPTNGDKSS